MNLNPREGHSIVLLPSENYGISCKIALFKPKVGKSAEYSKWLIQNSKKVHGVKKAPIKQLLIVYDVDEDFLA